MEIPYLVQKELMECGFACNKIGNENEFICKLTKRAIVVLDGYHFDFNYQKQIKATGSKLVCIDDMHDKEFVADLIINHTPGILPQDYRTLPSTQFALGLNYALLRPVFLEQLKNVRRIDKVETIFICFGGADPKGLTAKVVRTVADCNKFKNIIVVTGAAFKITCEFDQLLLSYPQINHRHNLSEKQMLDTMLESELAVVPASVILLEALSAGCIVISGIMVENQKNLYENFRKAGLIIDAGSFLENELIKAISSSLILPLIQNKTAFWKSSENVLKIFIRLKNESLINLREVKTEDFEITYKWASDSKVRSFSFNQHQISLLEHTNWFNRKLSDLNCLYLIAEFGERKVGSIRFDQIKGEAVVSYLLDPKFHGNGFGQILLKKGIERLVANNLNKKEVIKQISGEVMKTNISSIKVFERLGFIKKDFGNKYRFDKYL
jgi:spore coat polysaccharide biosynthesis predicted glycosyltransferase SpsG/L-amino acid N-acyltransferase YncA